MRLGLRARLACRTEALHRPRCEVGFHAAFMLEGEAPLRKRGGERACWSLLERLRFSGEAIYYFTSAPPESMNWLTPEKAVELGISVEPWTPLDEMTKQSDEGQ